MEKHFQNSLRRQKKIMALKQLFDISIVVEIQRFEVSIVLLKQYRIYEWARDLHFYTYYFQESRLSLFWSLGQASETRCEREIRVSDKEGDSKRPKITLSFTRRYLGNRKSCREKSKSILKRRIFASSDRSFIDRKLLSSEL